MLAAELLAVDAHLRAYNSIAMLNAQALLAARPVFADMDRLTLAPHADEAPAGADALALAIK